MIKIDSTISVEDLERSPFQDQSRVPLEVLKAWLSLNSNPGGGMGPNMKMELRRYIEIRGKAEAAIAEAGKRFGPVGQVLAHLWHKDKLKPQPLHPLSHHIPSSTIY